VPQKTGNERNSPTAQTAFISDPFSAAHKRLRPERFKVKSKVKRNVKSKSVETFADNRRAQGFDVDVGLVPDFRF
jgi:hypothetical protein